MPTRALLFLAVSLCLPAPAALAGPVDQMVRTDREVTVFPAPTLQGAPVLAYASDEIERRTHHAAMERRAHEFCKAVKYDEALITYQVTVVSSDMTMVTFPGGIPK